MNQLEYLTTGKRFLRKVAAQRLRLLQHNVGYLPPSLSSEPNTVLYHLRTINSADQLHRYIQRKESAIKMMIPANCTKWFDELRELLAGVGALVEN
jgi:hypothetical protein